MYGPERTEILIACRNFDPNSDNFAILYDSAVALAKKEAKRRKPHWKLATETILVLELVDRFRLEFAYLQVLFGEAPTGHPPAGQNASKALFRSMAGQFKSPASFLAPCTPVQ
jgi:hypothetical protein